MSDQDDIAAARGKALEFLGAHLALLYMARTKEAAEELNALVKAKLARFPSLFAEKWSPEYLGKLKALSK